MAPSQLGPHIARNSVINYIMYTIQNNHDTIVKLSLKLNIFDHVLKYTFFHNTLSQVEIMNVHRKNYNYIR